jgi:hypothetical protein
VKRAAIAVGLLCFAGLGVALLSASFEPPPDAPHPQCQENLRRLAQAMLHCEDVVGTVPPPASTDWHGHVIHSWRVVVLPFLDAGETYAGYDFSLPWNSPKNQALLKNMPAEFHCPDDTRAGETETSYVRVTGPQTVGESPDGYLEMHNITDGPANTILLVETAHSGINWLDPNDITLDEFLRRANRPGFSPHEGGFWAAFCDGSVRFIHTPIDPEILRRLVIRNDGKPVDLDKL